MPIRITEERINGRTPAEFNSLVYNEFNAIAARVRLRGVRQWRSSVWENHCWASVRYRAIRLQALRQRITNSGRSWMIGLLPVPSVLEQLPSAWYENGGLARAPRRSGRSATTSATLSAPAVNGTVIPPSVMDMEPALAALTFGVELEHYTSREVSRSRLAQLITASGHPTVAESYNHHLRTHWKCIYDQSLGDLVRGTEVVSPILQGTDGMAKVAAVCKVMEDNGGTVRRKAGLHVHIGMRNQNVEVFKRVLKLYAYFEGSIDQITSRSRRGNSNGYCHSTRLMLERNGNEIGAATNMVELCRAYSRNNRFMKVNLESFWRHGTVEFRQHQGTVSGVKAQHWIKFCLKLVQAAIDGVMPSGDDTLQNLASTIKLPAPELAYYERRMVELTRVAVERR